MWEANAQICINPTANQEQQLFQSIPSPVLVTRQYQKSRNHRRNDHPLKPSPTPHQWFDAPEPTKHPMLQWFSQEPLLLTNLCRSLSSAKQAEFSKGPAGFAEWNAWYHFRVKVQDSSKGIGATVVDASDPVEVGQSMFHSYTSSDTSWYVRKEPWNLSKHQIPGGMTGCIRIYDI